MTGQKLLITGARIWTAGLPWNSPLGDLLISERVVEAVEPAGTLDENGFPGVRRLKLPGGVILPAFFDGHLHLDIGGTFLSRLALRDCATEHEVLGRLAHEAHSGRDWLIAVGLPEHAWPSYTDLRRATRGRPAILFTRDYHSAFVNPEGMEALDLTPETPPPPGGSFEHDSKGQPTGLLRENAVRWAEHRLPAPSEIRQQDNLLLAAAHLVKQGVLGVSDASDNSAWPMLAALDRERKTPLRVEHWHRCLELDDSCLEIERVDRPRLKRLRIKTFLDGSLGSRTAWMLEEYDDNPGKRGGPVPELEGYRRFLRDAAERGWSHAVHAIGDAAVEWAAQTLAQLPAAAIPHRIEHVQHVNGRGLESLSKTSVLASIQPTHRLEDSGMLLPRLGLERAGRSYPQRSLLRGRGTLVFGTDWPVVSSDPRKTLYAALSPRKAGEGMTGEQVTLEQALEAMTSAPARAAGFKGVGELSPAAPADFLWMPADPARDPAAWLEAEIGGVWAAGELVHAHHEALP